MSSPKVKFVYFDLQGKGELTRLLLKCGKIDFEDFRFGFDDWPKHKPTTPFGQVHMYRVYRLMCHINTYKLSPKCYTAYSAS